MRRLPIRIRLTAAFALAMVALLAAAGLFVYLQLRDNLDETIADTLESRTAAAEVLVQRPVGDPEDEFVQLLSPEGQVIARTGGAESAALSPEEARRAAQEEIEVTREVDGIDGRARIRGEPAADGGGSVAVAGVSLEDRDETLAGVASSFAIGGPIAVLVASLLGYLLAAGGLRPVEAMRRRAAEISLEKRGGGESARLPLPPAGDEIHRLATTLNDMLARLESSFERERQFVADASHELRTPIATVKTEIEAALRGGDAGPHARESLVAASEEIDHLAQLADDLLLIARSGDGALPVTPTRTHVRALLDSARERFADRAAERDRAFAVEAPAGLTANVDPVRMRQALGNLVDNALRYGDGTIRLTARPAGRNGAVEIAVSDDGAGFPPDLAAHAFERFVRGDSSRTTSGSGLGLAIVKAIAEAHGGTARIDGAAVAMTLP